MAVARHCPSTFRRWFSSAVTVSMWRGLTHREKQQRWSRWWPVGQGCCPRTSAEKRCALTVRFPSLKEPYHLRLPFPRERAPVHTQQPLGSFSTYCMKRSMSSGLAFSITTSPG